MQNSSVCTALSDLTASLPISRSTWLAGVASGRYPQPVKLGPKITAWRLEDIQKLIDWGVE